MKIDSKEFEKAYQLISSLLPATPLVKNDWLSRKYEANVFLKLESLQPVGSFKLRGAANKIFNLTDEEKKKGVVAVSAGNHAQGVAWAAQKLGVEATIIMPKPSPVIKILNTESLGAKVILEGDNVDESFQFLKEYLKENDKVLVHPFHDPLVIAGQGTIGHELRNQIDDIHYLFGAIGGGGLMAGVGQAVRELFPSAKIIGTQASGASSMAKSLQQGKLVPGESVATFADGIKVKQPNEELYQLLDQVIDEAVHIPDDQTALALLELMEQARIITEGAGAIALAAFNELYNRNPRQYKNKNIVLIICGGNIDINLVDRIIEKGLLESHRRIKIDLLLDDRPGSLYEFTKLVKEMGGNILQVTHERNAPYLELQESIVEAVLETKGREHAELILEEISKKFKTAQRSFLFNKSTK